MTTAELAQAIGDRTAGELVLVVGPGHGQLELLRLATPFGLRVSPGALPRGAWELVPVRDWMRARDQR